MASRPGIYLPQLHPRLSELGRVIVPDHTGFGKSETPQDREYSVEEHCDNLDALLLSLDLKNVTLVMQDWGGPIGTNFAFRHPERIKRLLYIDSMTRAGLPAEVDVTKIPNGGMTPWSTFFMSESFDPVTSNLSRTILSVLKLVGFNNNDVITDDWLQAYAAPFPTAESCKGAKAFPLATIDPASWAYTEAAMKQPGVVGALREKPAMMVIGEDDVTAPAILVEGMLPENWADAPFITLPNVNHYSQEDAPGTLLAMIEQFVREH